MSNSDRIYASLYLADISAMANTVGGDVLYGVKELRDGNGHPTGIADDIIGVEVPNPDQLRLQILQLIRDGIDPRIPGIETQTVDLPTGRVVFIIRIPPSLLSPHMVTYKRQSPFFTRSEG